jgi:hypothetical protein
MTMKDPSATNHAASQTSKCCLVAALVFVGGSGLLLLLLFAVAAWMTTRPPPGMGPLFNSYVGTEPPPLDSNGTWLNVPEPLELADLRGQTVWLEFSFMH